jgi:transcriptional regulator with XRE-family HTH domain
MTKELPERHEEGLNVDIQSQLQSFGARLRELRLQKGWTLEELACRSALSRPFLSRLESGGRQASIAAALTLSRIFDVSLASLFESQMAAEPCVIVRAGEAEEQTANGLQYASLSRAGRFFNLQPIRVKVPLARPGEEHYHHEGEEWIYLLSGSLTLSLAGKTYELEQGDSAHFDSRLPHRLIACGSHDAEVLLVASPLSSTSPMIAGWQAAANQNQQRAIPAMGLMSFPQSRTEGGPAVAANSSQSRMKISRITKK